MNYLFSPSGRIAATQIVTPKQRVKLIPGSNEMDDAVWNDIKDDSTIAQMLEAETLRVISAPSSTPPKTKPNKPEG